MQGRSAIYCGNFQDALAKTKQPLKGPGLPRCRLAVYSSCPLAGAWTAERAEPDRPAQSCANPSRQRGSMVPLVRGGAAGGQGRGPPGQPFSQGCETVFKGLEDTEV